MSKFKGFRMFQKQKTFADSVHDVCITTSYISFSKNALKHLGVKVGDRVAIAAIDNEDGSNKVLLAASALPSAREIIINRQLKRTSPITYTSVGKKLPETKGNYYLKKYGSHEDHAWFECVIEKPKLLQMF